MVQLVLPLEVRSATGRADFIVAPGNQAAVTFIDSFPNWVAPAAVLHGPPASGKSHLAAVWAETRGSKDHRGGLARTPTFPMARWWWKMSGRAFPKRRCSP